MRMAPKRRVRGVAKAKAAAGGRVRMARPAAVVAPRGPGRVRMRPAMAPRGGGQADPWEDGQTMELLKVPQVHLLPGSSLVLEEANYYGKNVKVAGKVRGLIDEEDRKYLMMHLHGTDSEEVLKTYTGDPTLQFKVHLCKSDCDLAESGERVLHCKKGRKEKMAREEAWVRSLEGVLPAAPPVGPMERLARRSAAMWGPGADLMNGPGREPEKEEEKEEKKEKEEKEEDGGGKNFERQETQQGCSKGTSSPVRRNRLGSERSSPATSHEKGSKVCVQKEGQEQYEQRRIGELIYQFEQRRGERDGDRGSLSGAVASKGTIPKIPRSSSNGGIAIHAEGPSLGSRRRRRRLSGEANGDLVLSERVGKTGSGPTGPGATQCGYGGGRHIEGKASHSFGRPHSKNEVTGGGAAWCSLGRSSTTRNPNSRNQHDHSQRRASDGHPGESSRSKGEMVSAECPQPRRERCEERRPERKGKELERRQASGERRQEGGWPPEGGRQEMKEVHGVQVGPSGPGGEKPEEKAGGIPLVGAFSLQSVGEGSKYMARPTWVPSPTLGPPNFPPKLADVSAVEPVQADSDRVPFQNPGQAVGSAEVDGSSEGKKKERMRS